MITGSFSPFYRTLFLTRPADQKTIRMTMNGERRSSSQSVTKKRLRRHWGAVRDLNTVPAFRSQPFERVR